MDAFDHTIARVPELLEHVGNHKRPVFLGALRKAHAEVSEEDWPRILFALILMFAGRHQNMPTPTAKQMYQIAAIKKMAGTAPDPSNPNSVAETLLRWEAMKQRAEKILAETLN